MKKRKAEIALAMLTVFRQDRWYVLLCACGDGGADVKCLDIVKASYFTRCSVLNWTLDGTTMGKII